MVGWRLSKCQIKFHVNISGYTVYKLSYCIVQKFNMVCRTLMIC